MRKESEKQVFYFRFSLKKLRRRITYSRGFIHFLASLASLVILLYIRSLKIKFYLHPEIKNGDRARMFYAFWHQKLLLLMPSFGNWHTAIITDVSWAGEIITKILENFGYFTIRGSSKRRGVEAILNMKKAVEQGYSGAIATDGPRGPIYKSKPGILYLAQKLKYPIAPTTVSANKAWLLKQTWDEFFIPKPFAKCYIAIGKPICKEAINGQLNVEELDQILINWSIKIDRKVGME